MTIKDSQKEYPLKFGACTQIETSNNRVEKIILMTKEKEIELDAQECDELMNVLKGVKCLTMGVVYHEDDYMPHTVINNSTIKKQTSYSTIVMSRKQLLE